ncbi:hypothetical protein HMN09_00352000 [Mycena chlorophos]|uniref:Uncharacterized protein n=1 Tax=Mycena chlorophos TaxID=658473 RepID=A0A8H6TIN7_MYCCL|nr:hypothetical protein HMN09_00352000 [Mycena chlorophos]
MPLLSFARFGVSSPTFDPRAKFVSSPVLPLRVFAGLRILLAGYALAAICTDLGFDVRHGFLSYFTDLSYIGLTSYYIAAAVQTAAFAFSGGRLYPLRSWGRVLQLLHVLLQTTIVCFRVSSFLPFFAFVSPRRRSTRRDHRILVLALQPIHLRDHILRTSPSTPSTPHSPSSKSSCPTHPPPHGSPSPLHIFFLACYLGVAYITYHTQHFYTYDFLDPVKEGGLLAAYIVGIAVGEAIVFVLVRGVVVLRQRWALRAGRVLGVVGADGQTDDREALDDWEEVERPVDDGAVAEKSPRKAKRNASAKPEDVAPTPNDSGVVVSDAGDMV